MTSSDDLRDQLDSLHAISVEIAALHEMSEIHERALNYCRALTASEFAFTGLLVDGSRVMDVVAIEGFYPLDEDFYERFHLIPVRSSVVGVAINEEHAVISNDVLHDPRRVGQPAGHPPVRKFLGVPLRVGDTTIGMIGVANKTDDYGDDDERILATLANQVAVAIENARLYERQQGDDRESATTAGASERGGANPDTCPRAAAHRRRLHDQIEQEVFSIGLGIDSLLEGSEVDPRTAERLRAVRQLAVETADEVRRVTFALAVPGHANGDLTSDVRSLLRDLERRSFLETHLVVRGSTPSGVEQVQDTLYSVVNEAITNVERHAQAKMVLVSIRFEDDRVDVVVQDDGVGVSALVVSSFQDSYLHFGLRHMRQQVLNLGGIFELANGEESGTIVRVSVPLPPDSA